MKAVFIVFAHTDVKLSGSHTMHDVFLTFHWSVQLTPLTNETTDGQREREKSGSIEFLCYFLNTVIREPSELPFPYCNRLKVMPYKQECMDPFEIVHHLSFLAHSFFMGGVY